MPPLHHKSSRRLRVLLCGYGHLALAILQGLLACAEMCEVVGVFRWTARPKSGPDWEPVEAILRNQVARAGIPDVVCGGMNSYEFIETLQRLQPDVVLVGSWGEILKPHVLEFPGVLFLNCHPSLLPAHRGANPYASVVLQNEAETGVTFHCIVPCIDAGDIVLQRSIPLTEEESGASVRDKCMAVAGDMVPALLKKLSGHILEGEPLRLASQDEAQASYFSQLKPEHGLLDWHEPVIQMNRRMRALFPWIAGYTFIGRWKVTFYNLNFALLPAPSAQHVPTGTILPGSKGVLAIALSDPEWVLESTRYQISKGGIHFPLWLSRWLALFLLRPGKRFFSKA